MKLTHPAQIVLIAEPVTGTREFLVTTSGLPSVARNCEFAYSLVGPGRLYTKDQVGTEVITSDPSLLLKWDDPSAGASVRVSVRVTYYSQQGTTLLGEADLVLDAAHLNPSPL